MLAYEGLIGVCSPQVCETVADARRFAQGVLDRIADTLGWERDDFLGGS